VPRKTKVLFQYKRDLEKMQSMGFYAQVDKVVVEEGSHDTEHEQVIKDATDKYEGKDRNEHISDAPYYLFEYHGCRSCPARTRRCPFGRVAPQDEWTSCNIVSRATLRPVRTGMS